MEFDTRLDIFKFTFFMSLVNPPSCTQATDKASIVLIAHHQEMKVPTKTRKEARSLPIGDFVWIVAKGQDERLGGVIVERKRSEDLLKSLWDGRLNDQLTRMISTEGINRVIYIVEGSLLDCKYGNLAEKLISKLESEGAEVVLTNSIVETGRVLDRITESIPTDHSSFATLTSYGMFQYHTLSQRRSEPKNLIRFLDAIEGLGRVTRQSMVAFLEQNGGASLVN